jgi:uncharacterized protein YdcH (DUF465 family)
VSGKYDPDLPKLTIDRVAALIRDTLERCAYDKSRFTGEQEKHNAVHDMLKHCLIHNIDHHRYIRELVELDPSFVDPVNRALQDYPELTDPIKHIDNQIEALEAQITMLRLKKEKLTR